MDWGSILTSGITSAAVSTVVGGIVSYVVSRRIQLKEHEYTEEKDRKKKADAEKARLESIKLNKAQKEILEFCRANLSKRYKLGIGPYGQDLLSVDTGMTLGFGDELVGRELEGIIDKGYATALERWQDAYYHFELTEQGKTQEI